MLRVACAWVFLSGYGLSRAAALGAGRESLTALQEVLLGQAQSDTAVNCETLSSERIQQLNLTVQEREVLPSICWHEGELGAMPVIPQQSRGIPEGLSCTVKRWCDSSDCTEVCERGSVQLEPWHKNALEVQNELAKRLPFCYAALLGTHNSGITIADGYGNLDARFQQYFKWIRWVANNALLRTNDQYLSLTDQMNLGVRSVELDTHFFEGSFRIAHCGGYHGNLNLLISALNVVAKLLGHEIRWDTETIGCEPSLSSIPVLEQRTLVDALKEVHAWLEANPGEFVVLYLDDQEDIARWELVPALLADFAQVFTTAEVFTPLDLAALGSQWPSIHDMLAEGKRILVVSGVDYLTPMAPLIFSRKKVGEGSVCSWSEYPFEAWQGEPSCAVYGDHYPGIPHTLEGVLLRESACEIQYGPLNCDMVWRPDNAPFMDEGAVQSMSRCGLNMPSPDLLTTERSIASIWSWAPGHPFNAASPTEGLRPAAAGSPHAAASGWWQPWLQAGLQLGRRWLGPLMQQAVSASQCAATSAQDGRWRAVDCGLQLRSACRGQDGKWLLAEGARGTCPSGTMFELPRQAKENTALQHALQQAALLQAWLPMQGPDWSIPPMGHP